MPKFYLSRRHDGLAEKCKTKQTDFGFSRKLKIMPISIKKNKTKFELYPNIVEQVQSRISIIWILIYILYKKNNYSII